MTRAGRRIAIAVTVVAGVTLILAPSAMARRTGLFADVGVLNSKGYNVSISAERWKRPRRHAKVFVTVQGSPIGGLALSSYQAPARLTRHHLRANLGDFGEINLRFHPTKRHHALRSEARLAPEPGVLAERLSRQLIGCGVSFGGPEGRFKGRIRFRGEDGYVRIRAHKARGSISSAELDCSNVKSGHGVALDAASGRLRFEADRYRRVHSGSLFVAKQKEKAGRVGITRIALAGAHKKAFSFDFNPNRAHVAPEGETMTGTADLTPSGQWTGSLAVSFPGAPDVPLAGPEFSARLGRF